MLAQPPDVHTSIVTSSKICSPPPSISTEPAIVLAHFEYKPGDISNALKEWEEVVEYVAKNEFWTRGYTVSEEQGKNNVRTVETYESWDFLEKVHLKNKAISKNQSYIPKDRISQGAVRVVAVDGFLAREGKPNKL